MQIHELKRKNPNKKSTQVGRGGKRGKTSGRGHKGQKSRAGHKIRPEMRDFIKKIPKKRGYRFKSYQEKPQTVNLSALNELSGTVNARILVLSGLVKEKGGKLPLVKVLGTGDIKGKVNLQGILVTENAKAKIEGAGGSVK